MNNDQVSALAWLSIGLVICVGSIPYKLGLFSSPGSGFMPFLSGITISLFAGVGFIQATAKKRKGKGWTSLMLGWKRAGVILASLLAYSFLLAPIGFLLCTILFVAFLLRAFAPRGWLFAIGISLLTSVAAYAIFELWLKVQLPKGYFGI